MRAPNGFDTELRRRQWLELALAAAAIVAGGGLVAGFWARSGMGFAVCGGGCVAAGLISQKLEQVGWRMPILIAREDDAEAGRPTRLNDVLYFLAVFAFVVAAALFLH
jgi:hypothetical protein